MQTSLIARHWDGVGDKQYKLVETFYNRLFERHPGYRALFPQGIDSHMYTMVDTLALIAKGAEMPGLFAPHLQRIGTSHQRFGLRADDFYNFISVLLEVMGEFNTQAWSPECEKAWGEALEQFILPHMIAGTRQTV